MECCRSRTSGRILDPRMTCRAARSFSTWDSSPRSSAASLSCDFFWGLLVNWPQAPAISSRGLSNAHGDVMLLLPILCLGQVPCVGAAPGTRTGRLWHVQPAAEAQQHMFLLHAASRRSGTGDEGDNALPRCRLFSMQQGLHA